MNHGQTLSSALITQILASGLAVFCSSAPGSLTGTTSNVSEMITMIFQLYLHTPQAMYFSQKAFVVITIITLFLKLLGTRLYDVFISKLLRKL